MLFSPSLTFIITVTNTPADERRESEETRATSLGLLDRNYAPGLRARVMGCVSHPLAIRNNVEFFGGVGF
jgi:hypothetical protein